MLKDKVVLAACAASLCGSLFAAPAAPAGKAAAPAAKAPEVVSKISQADAVVFMRLTNARTARFDELAVFQRVLNEKTAELRDSLAGLEKNHGLDPKKSYLYEASSRKVFELTPADKPGAEAKRKEVKAFADAKAATPLADAMMTRKIVENQLTVLRQLVQEKAQEATLVDGKLRKIFKLDPQGIYSFDAKTLTIYKTGVKAPPAPAKAAKPAPAKTAKK